jgi:AsmA protein
MAWRRISPLLAVMTALAIMLVAALALLPLAISQQRVRDHIAYDVQTLLGADLDMREPPTLSYFPSFRATFEDVALTRPGASQQPPTVTAERVEIDLSFWSALAGHVNVTSVRLVRPHFTLGADNGTLSAFLQNALATRGSRIASIMSLTRSVIEANPADPDISKLPSMRLGRLTIEDGLLAFRRTDGKGEEQISSINGLINWPHSDSAISVKLHAIWHGEAAHIEASSARPLFLFAGGTAPIKLSLTSTPLNLSLDGNANLSSDLFASGKLSLSSPSLRRILEWSRTKIDPGTAIGSVDLDATMTLAQDRMKLDNVALTLDGNPGKGVLEIGTENGMPKIGGTLAFGSLNLQSFLSAFTPMPDNAAPAKAIDTQFLSQLGLDIRFSADTATAGPFSLTKVAATAQVKSGQANFDIGDSTIYGGSLQASFQLNRTADDSNAAELRLTATDVDSSAVAAALGIQDQFPLAHVSGSAVLKGPISDWASAAEGATGTVQVHFGQGKVDGFDFAEFVKRTRGDGFFAIDDMAKSSFAFDAIDVKADIGDGVATLTSANLKAKDGAVTLSGLVPFVGRSLALSGHLQMPDAPAKAAAASTGKAVDPRDIYFFVGGSWNRPFVSPVMLGPVLIDHH